MTTRTVVTTCLGLLLTTVALAGNLEVPALPPEALAGPPAGSGPLSLDLLGAFQLALARNLDLQVGRYGVASADSGILVRSGIFDPTLSATVNGNHSETPSASPVLAGADVVRSRGTTFGLGLNQLLPTGTQLQVQAGSNRIQTNSSWYLLNPSWGSSLTASLTQPLLNGFGTTVNRASIVIARNARGQTATGFSLTVISTLLQVERAYWDLIAARERVKVTEQSVELATRLLNETQERVKVGTSAPIDLVQSEAGVATRRQELISARNAAANAEDALKALLGFDQPDEWQRSIETTEKYEMQPLPTDLDLAIRTALVDRPELQQKALALEASELNVRLARNAVLPTLNLQASYGYSGTGGKGEIQVPVVDPATGEPVIDPDTGQPVTQTVVIDTGLSRTWTEIRDRTYPSWTLGLNLSVPVGNHNAEGTLAERRYELEKGKTELAALKQQVIHDVRLAVRAVDDGAAAIDAAVASSQLARRNLEAEYTKFNNGLSTNYQVLQIQRDLADAELAELQARINYRKALSGLRAATGTLLQTVGVEIVDPGAPEVPNDYWKNVRWLQFTDLKDPFGPKTEQPTAKP